jgi:hypothetical protein
MKSKKEKIIHTLETSAGRLRLPNGLWVGALCAVLAATAFSTETWNPMNTAQVPVPNGVLDLSSLNTAPAGAFGRLRSNDRGELFFEDRPDETVRFNGANFCFEMCFPTKEQAPLIADMLVRRGYNVIRMHHHDERLSWSPHGLYRIENDQILINEADFDLYDNFVAELKRRGIYIITDVYVRLSIDKISSIRPLVEGGGRSAAKFAMYFAQEPFDAWKTQAALFLTHTNAYTGLTPAKDPVYASITPVNEDPLTAMRIDGKGSSFSINTRLAERVLSQLNEYRKEHFNAAPMASIYSTLQNVSQADAPSVLSFLTDVTVSHYAKQTEHMRKLGYDGLLGGGLSFMNNTLTGYWRSECTDLFETHMYLSDMFPRLDGRWWDLNARKDLSPGYVVPAKEMHRMTSFLGSGNRALWSYFPGLSLTLTHNQPLFLTEYNSIVPFPGREEAGILTASVARFAGWDMLNRFSYNGYPEVAIDTVPIQAQLNLAGDPPGLLSESIASLLMRGNYLKESPVQFLMIRDREETKKSKASTTFNSGGSTRVDYLKNMDFIPHLVNIRTVFADYPDGFGLYQTEPGQPALKDGKPVGTKLKVPTGLDVKGVAKFFISCQKDPAVRQAQLDALQENRLLSDTGELTLDLNSYTYLIDAPAVMGILGGMNDRNFTFGSGSFRSTAETASFISISKDGLPLPESRRMLLLFITDVKGTGEKFVPRDEKKTEYHMGKLPTLARMETAEWSQRSKHAASLALYRVAMNGERLEKIPLTLDGDQIRAVLDTRHGFTFELVDESPEAAVTVQ